MRIAILSDTHGNYALAVRILDLLGGFEHIIHLGDTSHDAEIIEQALERELIMISGNCDAARKYPESLSLEFSGKKIFISHGDRFQVKAGLAKIYEIALKVEADIVLYGHTHVPHIEEINGILFMNPGTLKKSASQPTVGILNIEGGSASAEIIEINRLLNTAVN